MEQKRFIIALVLSGAILLVWQFFVAPPPEEAPGGEQAVEQTADAGSETAGGDQQADAGKQQAANEADAGKAQPSSGAQGQAGGEQGASEGGEQAAEQAAAAEQAQPAQPRNVKVRTDALQSANIHVELTNKDAAVTTAKIIAPEQYLPRGDLVGFPKDAKNYPYSVRFLDQSVDLPASPVYRVDEDKSVEGKDGNFTKLVYTYDDPKGRFEIVKTFSIDEEIPYVVNMDVAVTNTLGQGRLVDTMAVDVYDWKNPDEEKSFLNFHPNTIEGVCKTSDDTERENIKSVVDSPQRYDEGDTLWGGVDTRYFMMAAIPKKPGQRCELKVVDDNYLRTRVVEDGFSLAPGETKTMSHQLFMGPKDVDVLEHVGSKLEESVDYGMFAFIARPMRWGLVHLYGLVGNWGLAIILLTFVIRGLLWPVNMKAYSSMERMKQVQPLLNEVKEKYSDDKQRQTEETMKIFRENNVSPAGGCLPMLMQMPILYGLYRTIYNSVELYHADFALWYDNLAAPDPYWVLPILMGVVMFLQQRMSTVDQTNQQAAMMMKIMPLMFAGFMFFLPSGLVLYYALSLLIGVGQQYYIRKKYSSDEEPAAA